MMADGRSYYEGVEFDEKVREFLMSDRSAYADPTRNMMAYKLGGYGLPKEAEGLAVVVFTDAYGDPLEGLMKREAISMDLAVYDPRDGSVVYADGYYLANKGFCRWQGEEDPNDLAARLRADTVSNAAARLVAAVLDMAEARTVDELAEASGRDVDIDASWLEERMGRQYVQTGTTAWEHGGYEDDAKRHLTLSDYVAAAATSPEQVASSRAGRWIEDAHGMRKELAGAALAKAKWDSVEKAAGSRIVAECADARSLYAALRELEENQGAKTVTFSFENDHGDRAEHKAEVDGVCRDILSGDHKLTWVSMPNEVMERFGSGDPDVYLSRLSIDPGDIAGVSYRGKQVWAPGGAEAEGPGRGCPPPPPAAGLSHTPAADRAIGEAARPAASRETGKAKSL